MKVPEPAFYRRIGQSVNIDLGSLAKLGAIEDAVKALDTKSQLISNKIDQQGLALKQEIAFDGDKTRADAASLRTAVLDRVDNVGSQISSASTTLSSGIQAAIQEVRKLEPDVDAVASTASSTLAAVQALRDSIKQTVLEALDEHDADDDEDEHDDFTEHTIVLVGKVTCLQLALLNPATRPEEFNALLGQVHEALKGAGQDGLEPLLPEAWTGLPDLHARSEDYWDLEALVERLADATVPDGEATVPAPAPQAAPVQPAAASKPAGTRKAKAAAAE